MIPKRPARASHSFRIPPDDLARFQEHHQATRLVHRLSFNEWVIQTLRDRVDREEMQSD